MQPEPLRNTVKGVRAASCPECNALPGARCTGTRGQARWGCHRARWNAYRDLRAVPVGTVQ